MTTHITTTSTEPILILGATGKTGSRVLARLLASGHVARGASRSSEITFDWTDRGTWAPALRGAGSVYITYQPDLMVAGSADDIAELVRLAGEAGVRRLVLLSGRGEPEAQACAQIVLDSGIDATIIECSWFAQNFTEDYLAAAVAEGVLALPVGPVGEPFVDVEDIADVAVAALTDPAHAGKTYELTGPRLLTFADVAAVISATTGRDVDFVRLSAQEYRAGLLDAGLPQPIVDLVSALFATLFDGRNASLGDGVQTVLGRPPRDLADVIGEAGRIEVRS
ncbi:NmrA family NAD(P)-binding protein [Williamsia sp.]|uniref:NmrA family NAD(P)-binding protein n=1 Tax=Williamsia sp. TaxID=1872085 RepID=UPI001A21F780|nr:NmrA family NAD(P)-binding protein [Williamsia sp.]MBJ7289983.1 NmrA family NAD(P)-binding protein [Williamsia sp.]